MPSSQHKAILEALERGDVDRAEPLCEAFVASGGGGEGLYLLGVVRSLKGDNAAAARLLDRAAELLPERPDIAYNRGVMLRAAGKLAEAAAEWRRAARLDPDHRDALGNLAHASEDLGAPAEAEALYRRILEHWPDDRTALFNFGNLCQRAGRPAEALDLYRRLVQAHPGFVGGWINLGMLLRRERQFDAAETVFRQAISVDPGSAGAHFNLATLLLGQGRWREGFAEYEWRLVLPEAAKPEWRRDPWTGTEPAGTRVILWGDQGYGDSIQFLRHVGAVAARGHRPILVVKREMLALAATAPGVESVHAPTDHIPAAEVHLALASLPHRLGLADAAELWTGAYLRADAPAPAELGPRTGGEKRAGIVWAGDPRHPNDAWRSAGLESLAPLFALPGWRWFSLQKGEAAEALARSPWAGAIADLAPALGDFSASAAALRELDALVTVDTAMAHLAGALGLPACVLLPRVDCDWRWMEEGERTPWYPTLRLFRQTSAGDWTEVAARIAAHLAATG